MPTLDGAAPATPAVASAVATWSWPSSAARSSSSRSRSSTAPPSSRARATVSSRLEVMDTAYYSILGRDLAQTGTETIYSPAGFDAASTGLPDQTWYHWGEAWLAAAAISIFGAAPLDARHFIVLPLVVLAAAAMTGTLVRRLTGATSLGRVPLRVHRVPVPGPDPAHRRVRTSARGPSG